MVSPQDVSDMPVEQESPARAHRSTSGSSGDPTGNLPSTHSSHYPPVKTSYAMDDIEEQERQRTMDLDSAMQISRARSASVVDRRSYSNKHNTNSSPLQERLQEKLFRDEERPMFVTSPIASEDDAQANIPLGDTPPLQPLDSIHEQPHENNALNGLPTYQPTFQSNFKFSLMNDFAAKERAHPDYLAASQRSGHFVTRFGDIPQGERSSHESSSEHPDFLALGNKRSRTLDDNESTKISHGKSIQYESAGPKKLGGKMALFESNSAAPPFSLSRRLPGNFSAMRSFERSRGDEHEIQEQKPQELNMYTHTGHDQPFRFSFYSNALSTTIHARTLSDLPAEGQSFESLFSADKSPKSDNDQSDSDSSTWWLDVTSPTDEEMKLLSKVFSIHPLTAEDIQMEETREKIELFRNYYLVCFRSFDQDPYNPTYLEPLNMYIVVFREGILSFHFHPTPHPQNVRRRIKQMKDYIQVTSDWISYALIDDITDAFGPLIQGIEYEADSIDELVLILKEFEQTDMLRRIGSCRKKVMGLLRLMGNKADVVKGLAKRCNENWTVAPKSDIGLYLSDIQDHLITMTQNLNHYEKILARSHSNYLAQISIEMTDANNQINDVLSKLTALGTVLIPMNLITGLWGMNVHVPGQDDTITYTWFISIIGGLAAFALLGGFLTYRLMVHRQ